MIAHNETYVTREKESVIASKIFVGNLSYDTTAEELETHFSQIGPIVEVFLPSDRTTGRPRGFAFVEFEDDTHVDEAVEKFDGEELRGRPLRINRAQDRPSRPSFSDGGGPPRGGQRPSRPKGSRRGQRAKKRSL